MPQHHLWQGLSLGILAALPVGARDWLHTLLEADADVPAVALTAARATLAENARRCPLPASP